MCPGKVEIKGLGHIPTVGSIRFESGTGLPYFVKIDKFDRSFVDES